MKSKFFGEVSEAVLKTNILRVMLAEAMKVLDNVSEEMVLKETNGIQLYFQGIEVSFKEGYSHDIDGMERRTYVRLFTCNEDREIEFEVAHEWKEIVKGTAFRVYIDYSEETVTFDGEKLGNEGFSKKELTEAFGKYFKCGKSYFTKGEDACIVISAKAFPEIFS